MSLAALVIIALCLVSSAVSLRELPSSQLHYQLLPSNSSPFHSSSKKSSGTTVGNYEQSITVRTLTPLNFKSEITDATNAHRLLSDYLIEFYSPSCVACTRKKPLFEHVSKRLLLLNPRRNIKTYLYNCADHAKLMKERGTSSDNSSLQTLESMVGWANFQGYPYIFYVKGSALDSPIPFDDKLTEASLIAFIEGIIQESIPASAVPYTDPPDDDGDDDDDCDECSL